MNSLSTHDTPRVINCLGVQNNVPENMQGDYKLSFEEYEKGKELFILASVLQFTLPGVPCIYYGDENAMEGHIDPFCRRCFDWEHLNHDLISFYQKLGEIRKNYRNIFTDGNFENVYAKDGCILFKRINENGCIYVYVNNSSKSYLYLMAYSFLSVFISNIGRAINKIIRIIINANKRNFSFNFLCI